MEISPSGRSQRGSLTTTLPQKDHELRGPARHQQTGLTGQSLRIGADFDGTKDRKALSHSIPLNVHGAIPEEAPKHATDRSFLGEEGGRLLPHAAACGDQELVKELLDHGANVNIPDSEGRTALHKAAVYGRYDIARELLAHGARINAVDEDGRTALFHAVFRGDIPLAVLLIDNGANVNAEAGPRRTPLHEAVRGGHLSSVKLLVWSGANLNSADLEGRTPLHMAAARGDLEFVELLVESGAKTSPKLFKSKSTPLHKAAEANHPDVLHYLVMHGADVEVSDEYRQTPLHVAANKVQPNAIDKPTELQPTQAQFPSLGGIQTLTLRSLIHQLSVHLKRMVRPRIVSGYLRIEWTCTCGKVLYRDVEKSNTMSHQGSHQNRTNSDQHPRPVDGEGTSANHIETTSQSVGRSPPSSSSASTSGSESNSSSADSHSSFNHTISSRQNGSRQLDWGDRRFLEICVNTGRYTISLGEIDISKVANDGDLFARVAQRYRELRGSHLKRIFMKPTNIHYVLFSLERTYRVGLRDGPLALPPKEELDNRTYQYFCPYPLGPPPMTSQEFLHYFNYHAQGHPESIYLERLPKKLGVPLTGAQLQSTAHGWGIHIIEGPNRVLLTWCCVGILIISFVISLVYAVVMKTQEQGFGIGQWMVATLSAMLMALYFQWEEDL